MRPAVYSLLVLSWYPILCCRAYFANRSLDEPEKNICCGYGPRRTGSGVILRKSGQGRPGKIKKAPFWAISGLPQLQTCVISEGFAKVKMYSTSILAKDVFYVHASFRNFPPKPQICIEFWTKTFWFFLGRPGIGYSAATRSFIDEKIWKKSRT